MTKKAANSGGKQVVAQVIKQNVTTIQVMLACHGQCTRHKWQLNRSRVSTHLRAGMRCTAVMYMFCSLAGAGLRGVMQRASAYGPVRCA